MRYLSLFSGIEAATVAWHPLGWECVAVSEIEPFPCAVLAHHYPDVPNLGDVTKITEADIAALGPIDIVVAGSPCQDLSVAGHRKGLLDANGNVTRSGLFYTSVNIAHWARKHCGCRFMLWENVPGAFSSNKGRDFGSVVEFMAGLDEVPVPAKGWGTEGCIVGDDALVEWCVLDAQWFGVAQRRRRVFALADFGDWTRRPPVLLEPEGLRGDSPPRRGTGEAAAPTVGTGAPFRRTGNGSEVETVVAQPYTIANPLTARMHKGINSTLDEGQTPVVAFHPTQDPIHSSDGTIHAMGCGSKGGCATQAVAVQASQSGVRLNETVGTLDSNYGSRRHNGVMTPTMQVRRLTPVECERLQGFPDDYTLITHRGKPAADGPRYKALGNSMAVPVMNWIGRSLTAALWSESL